MDTLPPRGDSWSERLQRAKDALEAARNSEAPPPRVPDPWEALLSSIESELHEDQERISTHAIFDHLGLPRRKRSSASARRVARAMKHLGWEAARWRPRQQPQQKIRGFLRPAKSMNSRDPIQNVAFTGENQE